MNAFLPGFGNHGFQKTVRHATEIKLRAERKAGEILKVTPKNEGGRPDETTGTKAEPVSRKPKLEDLGVTKKESSRYQKMAGLPPEVFRMDAEKGLSLIRTLSVRAIDFRVSAFARSLSPQERAAVASRLRFRNLPWIVPAGQDNTGDEIP